MAAWAVGVETLHRFEIAVAWLEEGSVYRGADLVGELFYAHDEHDICLPGGDCQVAGAQSSSAGCAGGFGGEGFDAGQSGKVG